VKIYDSYGNKCNSRFLLNYGFIVENNCGSNEFPITIELSTNDKYYNQKTKLLNNFGLTRVFRISESLVEQTLIDMLSFMRFVEFDEDINTLINVL